MGRLVRTHSTYIEGLIGCLILLSKFKEIKTVIPGEIKMGKGKSEKLLLRITTRIKGGHKVIARKGNSIQEVFITTDISKEQLKSYLEEIID